MTEVELPVYIKIEGVLILTPESAQLLNLVKANGSLLKASKKLGISYNKSWKLLDKINQVSRQPAIIKTRGGKGGGGATLTDFGKRILKEYDLIMKEVQDYTSKLNTEINL